MEQKKYLATHNINGDLKTYLNWSVNALVPIIPRAADAILKLNRDTIINVAQKLLKLLNYVPGPIYRGVLLKHPVKLIEPHQHLEYLSFSTDRAVAQNFADVNGFGSEILDLTAQLGEYGYVIDYSPKITEVLFHYGFLSVLPYAEIFTALGMDGSSEVEGLKKQKEVTILQPVEPFKNITKIRSSN